MSDLSQPPKDSKYCYNCGKLVSSKAVMCPHCGIMFNDHSSKEVIEDRPSGLAITSLVTGILSFLCFFVLLLNGALAVVAIVMGAVDLNKIQNQTSCPKGRGLAIAGLCCGALTLVLFIALLIEGFYDTPMDYSNYL